MFVFDDYMVTVKQHLQTKRACATYRNVREFFALSISAKDILGLVTKVLDLKVTVLASSCLLGSQN